MGDLNKSEDDWQRRATAAAISAARRIVAGDEAAITPSARVGDLSDIEWAGSSQRRSSPGSLRTLNRRPRRAEALNWLCAPWAISSLGTRRDRNDSAATGRHLGHALGQAGR